MGCSKRRVKQVSYTSEGEVLEDIALTEFSQEFLMLRPMPQGWLPIRIYVGLANSWRSDLILSGDFVEVDGDLQNFAKGTQDFIISHPDSVWCTKGCPNTIKNTHKDRYHSLVENV